MGTVTFALVHQLCCAHDRSGCVHICELENRVQTEIHNVTYLPNCYYEVQQLVHLSLSFVILAKAYGNVPCYIEMKHKTDIFDPSQGCYARCPHVWLPILYI